METLNNNELLILARKSIQDSLSNQNSINKKQLIEKYPILSKPMATFVTLTIGGKLRGCIGTLVAHRTLFDDIVSNAKSSAFNDMRFEPLTKEEFEKTDIEISILSEPKKVIFTTIDDLKSKIKIGIDGMIIKQNGYQATFLPQVWEQLPTFEIFLNHLLQKAGIKQINNTFEAYTYNVDKIK